MANIDRSIFKSALFWLCATAFILSLFFVVFGHYLPFDSLKNLMTRLFFGSLFFLGVVIAVLFYLLFTKEENRESRRAARAARREERRLRREERRGRRAAIKELKKRFYEALGIIKRSRVYKKRAGYNYELPWYLVLGGCDDEQKRVLKSSGLDFPINVEYKEEEKEREGSFNWFFAEEAVFVTVPKEYVTLEKESSLHPVWRTFLKLFKKERWRRPINGIIFIQNAEDILHFNEQQMQEYAKVVREKLDEICRTFSSKIPVYMIVTGAREVPGFDSFFANLTEEERREVLGVTFEEVNEDISDDVIDTKMETLLQRLEQETIGNLHNSWDLEEREKILFFPEEFKAFLSNISRFTQKAFAKTRYYSPLMLRGVYFTDIGDTRGADLPVAAETAQQPGSPLFLPKVFDRIILSESQLVNTNDEYRKKFGILWLMLFSFFTLLLAGAVYYWSAFVQEEAREAKIIEDTYEQYLSLKQGSQPKIVLKRKAVKLENAMQIGRLGGANGADVSFGKGNASLTPFAKKELRKIVNIIQTLDETTKIKIVGHTDSIGDERSNMELSLQRAAAVKEFLVDNGIEEERISIEGAGEKSPVATNQTVEGRSLNRRVEIYAYGLKVQNDEVSYKEEYVIKNNLSDLQRVLGMLDALKSMRRENGDEIGRDIWNPGFYKIAKRDELVRKIYHESLQTLLLPRVATIVEKDMLLDLNDTLKTQTNLKAYLMLADKKHRDREFLQRYMLNRWGKDLEDTEIRRLNEHFSELLKSDFPPAKLHHKSIFRARKKLVSQAGVAGLIYKNLQKEAQTRDLNDFQFIEVLDAYPDAFDGAEYRIPGFYTKEGYEKILLLDTKSMIKKFMPKNWILGEESVEYDKNEIDRIYEKVLGLYFIDYRRYWTKAISSLHIKNYRTGDELADQLELLSSTISPVVLVLRAFRENTYLLTPKERAKEAMDAKTEAGVTAGEFLGSAGNKIDRLQRVGTNTMKEFASDKMVHDMRAIFKPYHELLDKNGEPSRRLKIVLRHVEKIYQQMLEVDTSADPKKSAFEIVSKKSTSSHKTFALKSNLLPPKLAAWYNAALENSWEYLAGLVDGHLDKTYNDEIWVFYTERIRNRFPLSLKSKRDISIDDFTTFFQKGGLLDKFYAKYVIPFVDVDMRTGKFKLKNVDGAVIKIDKQMVRAMISAKKIQNLLFKAGSNKPYFKISAKPKSLSSNLAAMDLIYGDDELFYEHGPVQNGDFVWPSKYPDTLAKYTLYDDRSNRVVKVRGDGEWALLRLLAKLDRKIITPYKMEVSYTKGSYSGTFEIRGKIVKIFTNASPFRHFRLKKN